MIKHGAGLSTAVLTVLLASGCSATEGDMSRGDATDGRPVAEATAERRVAVPDVVEMTLEQAIVALDGFEVETIGTAGEVDSQAPSGGIEVEPGSKVVLTVVDRAAEAAAAAAAAAAEEARVGTLSQQNAYRSAVSYLGHSAFSRAGIIGQLSSEYGEAYPLGDAEFAVARLEAEGGVDWNAEAAEAAASYLSHTAFSRQGLLDQLTSQYGEQFTPEQAEYGVSTTGL